MLAQSSWRTLGSNTLRQLKRLRSAFLRWPLWAKGGLVFGSALIIFNALGATSYFSYRWQLDSSREIPRSRELVGLYADTLAQLQAAREQEQRYLGRQKGGSLRAYQAALVELNTRIARLKPLQTAQDAPVVVNLAKLGSQLLQMSREPKAEAEPARGGIQLLGMRIERDKPAPEKDRSWALATAKEEEKLAAIQAILLDLKNAESARLDAWTRRERLAARSFLASILLGNLLAFALISLGGHSLMFHMSLGESTGKALQELRLFVDASAEAVYGVGLDGRCIFCNRALLRLLGYQDASDLMGQVMHPMVFGPQSVEMVPLLEALAEGKAHHGAVASAYRSDGSRLSVEYWSSPVHIDGRLKGAAVTLQDVSESQAFRHGLEQANTALQSQVRDLSRHSQEMSAFSELTEMLQASSSSQELCKVVTVFVKQLFPQDAGALYLMKAPGGLLEPVSTWGELAAPDASFAAEDCWSLRRAKPHYEEKGKEALFCAHLPQPLPAYSLCLPLIAQGGTLGVLHLHAGPGEHAAGLSESKQLLAVALTQQVALGLSNLRLREYLREDSIRDALTGLYNRRYMKESLDHEVSRAERNGSSVGLLAFDLDHFKEVNDQHGHPMGDRLLHDLGAVVMESVRSEDIACRNGGDEFVVILPGINAEQAMILAETLRKKVEGLVPEGISATKAPCTLSVGVAIYPLHGHSAEALQLAADQALYQAKSGGRNQVACAVLREKA